MIKRALLLTVILLAFSLVLRVVSTQHRVPLKKSFAFFPHQIDGYQLKATKKMDPKILKVLGVSNYLMGLYCQGKDCIDFYVGFFEAQQEGAMIHSPKHCMPGSGWVPLSSKIITLDTPVGKIRINRLILQKGEEKLLVYYWYQGRGRIIASEYKDRLYLLLDRLLKRRSDGALVRLMIPYGPHAEEKLQEFTRALLPVLKEFLPQ